MITYAELKRRLTIGTSITLTNYRTALVSNSDRLNKKRYVVKIQGNGVYLNADKTATKGSFLELPKASLIEADETQIKIYEAGYRDLTDKEKEIMAGEPKDDRQRELDAMQDTNTMFYRCKKYYEDNNAEYLFNGNSKVGTLHYDSNTGKVRDENIKGDFILTYQYDKEVD